MTQSRVIHVVKAVGKKQPVFKSLSRESAERFASICIPEAEATVHTITIPASR